MKSLRLPCLERAGLDGWMVRLFDRIEENNLLWLAALAGECETEFSDTLVDLVPSYTTLLVVFDPFRLTPCDARQKLMAILARLEPADAGATSKQHCLPTWYDPRSGPDLQRVAELSRLSLNAVIDAHSARDYRVFALGFAPGFAFMGLLDTALICPRLDTPRQHVPAGSVAIAGQQTAAYPAATPGGWNLIGRTPTRLFDRDRDGFSLLQVGDRVRFVPVDQATFEARGGDTKAVSQPGPAQAR